jgi:hypothetical protein
MKTKKRIITTNREIYEKCNLLNIVSKVLISRHKNLSKIIKHINKYETLVEATPINNKLILLTKKKPFKMSVYLR